MLGVHYKSGNFIDQYGRSYGNDPTVVGNLGADFISAQQNTGVAATAKHFPGLGAATKNQNADAGPVTLTQSPTKLRSVDEGPYTPAIAAGVKLVMVSWAVYTALDRTAPAALSSTIVQGESRSRLRFPGVTVTDALEAGALGSYGSTGNRAVLAAKAGMDLTLCSARDVTQGEAAMSALATALGNGQLDPTAFGAAFDRIAALRSTPSLSGLRDERSPGRGVGMTPARGPLQVLPPSD